MDDSLTAEDDDNTFGVEQIKAESSDPVLTDDADRYFLHLPLTVTYTDGTDYTEAGDTGAEPVAADGIETVLPAGARVQVTVTTARGSATTLRLAVPDDLSGRDVVEL